MEAIAKRANVSKETLYRWWHSKTEVILDTLTERGQQTILLPDTGTLRGTCGISCVPPSIQPIQPPCACCTASLPQPSPTKARHTRSGTGSWLPRHADLGQILWRGAARGEIDHDNAALALDLIYGSLWYRLIFRTGLLD